MKLLHHFYSTIWVRPSLALFGRCYITGQAAGAAAAFAVRAGGAVREVNSKSLRDALRAQGAYVPEV